MSSLLRLQNVSKIFNRNRENECIALDNVNLEIEEGDYVTIWGSNGAGKTSLLKAICDEEEISGGHVFLNGNNITHMPSHERAGLIGMVTQNTSDMVAGSLTLEEHLTLGFLRGKKYSLRKAISSDIRKKLEIELAKLGLGLEKRLEEKVSNLSGGERQAIMLLMASINKPKILLLDEHTAALDLEKTKLIEELTDKLVKTNHITTLWITHKKEQAARFGNRILFMHKGKIARDLSYNERSSLSFENLTEILEKFQMGSAYRAELPS